MGQIIIFTWASYQMRKIAGAHAPGIPGTFSPQPRVSYPDMHHGTCVTHVPWCMPGSLTSDFLWSQPRGKPSRHSRRMRNSQFYVYGKRPMGSDTHLLKKYRTTLVECWIILIFNWQQMCMGPFYWHGLTLIPAWISNYIHSKCGMKLVINSQFSTEHPLKFGNG